MARTRPTFRDVRVRGTFKGWVLIESLSGHVMALREDCLSPRGLGLLAAGWFETFHRLWPLPGGRGWDPVAARRELLTRARRIGELMPEEVPPVTNIWPTDATAAPPPEFRAAKAPVEMRN